MMPARDPIVGPSSGESRKPLASWYVPGLSDRLGDRLLMFDNSGAASLELLRFRPDLAAAPGFEPALRERVEELRRFQHPSFAQVRAVEWLGAGEGLALVSNYTPGKRLSEVFAETRGVAFALELIRQLAPALGLLHQHGSGIGHGALAADRIVVTPEGKLVIVEHVLGSALERLGLTAGRLRADLGIVVPSEIDADQVPRLDPRADLVQLALVALSLVLGRRIAPGEYPQEVAGLFDGISRAAAGAPIDPQVRAWFERALQLEDEPFETAHENCEALTTLPHQPEPASGAAPAVLLSVPAPDEQAESSPLFADEGIVPPNVRSDRQDERSAPAVEANQAHSTDPRNPRVVRLEARPPRLEPRVPGRVSPHDATPARSAAAPPASVEWTIRPGERPAALSDPGPGRRQPPAPGRAPNGHPPGWSPAPASARGASDTIQRRGPVTRSNPTGEPRPAFPPAQPPVEAARGLTVGRALTAAVTVLAVGEAFVIAALLLAPAAPAAVLIEAAQPGTKVMVDGRPAGVTPLQLEVRSDTKSISVAGPVAPPPAPARTPPARPRPSAATPSSPAAPPAAEALVPGGIRLVSPIEVQVFAGGRLLGSSLDTSISAAPGRHELELVNAALGYRSRQIVEIQAGQITELGISPPNGRLSINARPWAEVWIDGRLVGETPLGNLSVAPGEREIVFRHPELGEQRQTALVKSDGVTRVTANLQR